MHITCELIGHHDKYITKRVINMEARNNFQLKMLRIQVIYEIASGTILVAYLTTNQTNLQDDVHE